MSTFVHSNQCFDTSLTAIELFCSKKRLRCKIGQFFIFIFRSENFIYELYDSSSGKYHWICCGGRSFKLGMLSGLPSLLVVKKKQIISFMKILRDTYFPITDLSTPKEQEHHKTWIQSLQLIPDGTMIAPI